VETSWLHGQNDAKRERRIAGQVLSLMLLYFRRRLGAAFFEDACVYVGIRERRDMGGKHPLDDKADENRKDRGFQKSLFSRSTLGGRM
jgi:hypothetical protein